MRRLVCLLLACMCLSACSAGRVDENGQAGSVQGHTEVAAADNRNPPELPADSEPANPPALTPELPLANKIICVDPGHEVTDLRIQEPIDPYSSETKEAFVGGTSGRNQTEEQLNLSVGLRLQTLLEEQGATVIMTRTTHESDMTSYKRAMMANEEQADLCIRIHADGSTDPSVHGMSMLVPYGAQLATQDIVETSRVAGEYVLEATIAATGAKNKGIVQRSDLTGFNFAEVPTILIEMGFMSNPDEDALMETGEYQQKLAQGMCDGIVQYFSAMQSWK